MKTFVTLTLLLSLFICNSVQSQGVTLEASGDGKIFFLGDEDRGIAAGTADILIKSKWEFNQIEYLGVAHIGPTFEYADLPELPYRRYSVEGGFTFNELFMKNLFITPYIDLGLIHRGGGKFSYGFGMTTGYSLSKTLDIVVTNACVLRSDFPMVYGTESKIKWSLYVGFKMDIYNHNRHSSTTSRF